MGYPSASDKDYGQISWVTRRDGYDEQRRVLRKLGIVSGFSYEDHRRIVNGQNIHHLKEGMLIALKFEWERSFEVCYDTHWYCILEIHKGVGFKLMSMITGNQYDWKFKQKDFLALKVNYTGLE